MKQYKKNLGKIIQTFEGEWDIDKPYDILSIVDVSSTNKSYISKTKVPKGIDITNENYWRIFSNNGGNGINEVTRVEFESVKRQSENALNAFSGLGMIEKADVDGYEIALAKTINTANKTKVKVPIFDIQNMAKNPMGLVNEAFVEGMSAMMDDKINDALDDFTPPEEGGNNVTIVQETGASTTDVMSQKAVTNAINNEKERAERIENNLSDSIGSLGTTISNIGNELIKEKTRAEAAEKGLSDRIDNLVAGGGGGGGSTEIEVIDNLTSTSTTAALSANQGKILKENIGDWVPNDYGNTITENLNTINKALEDNVPDKAPTEGSQSTVTSGGVYQAIEDAVVLIPVPDEEDVTKTEEGKLKLADREYDILAPNGMGHVILRKNKALTEQITSDVNNTIYEIRYNFDLGMETVHVGSGCVLKFVGGKISNGIIDGFDTLIISDEKCLANVKLTGSWKGNGEAHWFAVSSPYGERGSDPNLVEITDRIDVTQDLQNALDAPFNTLHFRKGLYYITETLVIKHVINLDFDGGRATNYLFQGLPNDFGNTFLFTNKNITMLKISIDTTDSDVNYSTAISINGGNIDASFASTYTQTCLLIDISKRKKIWGLELDTNLFGPFKSYGVIPEGKGVGFLTDTQDGYATMIRIGGAIDWFGTAIDMRDGGGSNWITDTVITTQIANCPVAVVSAGDVHINGSIQPRAFFTSYEEGEDYPLIDVVEGTCIIDGMIWDVGAKIDRTIEDVTTTYYATKVVARIGDAINDVKLQGKVNAFYHNRITQNFRGNIGFLMPQISAGDKTNYPYGVDRNCLEGFPYRADGQSYNVKMYLGNGTETSSQPTVTGGDNMFNLSPSNTIITPPNLDYTNQYKDIYIEVKLTGIAVPIMFIAANLNFTETVKETVIDSDGSSKEVIKGYRHGFGEYEIVTVLNHQTDGVDDTVSYKSTVGMFANAVPYTAYFVTQNAYNAKEIIIRFKKLTGTTISINRLIANTLDTYGKTNTFLPVSGGNIYGDLSIKGEKVNYGRARVEKTGGVCRLFNAKASGSSLIKDTHILHFSTAYSTEKPKYAAYQFDVVGDGTYSVIYITLLYGNYDFTFSVKRKDGVDYAIYMNEGESTNAYTINVTKLNYESTGFEWIGSNFKSDEYTDYSVPNAHRVRLIGYAGYKPSASHAGCQFYQLGDNRPVWYNGSAWTDADGYPLVKKQGATSDRPTLSATVKGYQFFDTTLGKPIWWNGTAWVDATGTTV